MKRIWFLVLFIALLISAVNVSAQKVWEKSLDKWSKDDAAKVLSESPWAQSYQSADASAAAARIQSASEQTDQRIMGRTEGTRSSRTLGVLPVVIRVQSALPIRQAMLRMQQIAAGYDKMKDEQRKRFDAEAKTFLDCALCQKYHIITITKFKKSSSEGVDDGIFQSYKLEDLKGSVKLINDKGESRELVHFIAAKQAGDSAVLFFPRNDDKNNPLLTAQSKSVELIFNSAFLTQTTNPYAALLPRRTEFKVSKLLIGDNLNF